MPDRVGQQLGNYRLLRLLGRGGQASVYLGEHVYLKRRAALKVLHTSLEDEAVEQFLAEAQTLARLDHPNIVRVSDFAVEGGTPFLVMDYAPRGTLRTLHPPGSCLSLEATITSTKQVAAALQYAHNHQVIHRDVKPENMLLGPRQEVLLSDFGISLFAPSPQQLSTQEMSGTLPYMAPEQIRGRPVFASDQYSLGIIVYEWLCGVRPFAGSPWQIVSQQVSDPPPPLREHDPSLPQAVEDVVLKALAKDPRDRFVSVSLFAQALERACQEQPLDLRSETDVTAPLGPPSPVPPVTPTVAPRRVFVVAAQAEDAFVARLTADMQKRDVVCWQEGSDGTGQMHQQEHLLRQAIRAVEVVLVVVSPSTASSRTVKACLRLASLYQRRLVFVWAAGEEIADVLPPAWDNKAVQIDLVDAREERYEEALEELLASLEAEAPVEEFTLPEPATEPRNPYKGLRAFSQADAADFFGRDRLIEELVERMKALVTVEPPGMPTARLLSVIGPSGSGKSSVVMAGLLPRLRQGVLPGSEQWVYLDPMVPGTHPLEALALTLAPHLPARSLKNLREDVEDGSARGLHLLAKQLSTTGEQKVVLLVDQFEELFTLTTSEEERQQFIDLLTTAVTEPRGGVIVLLTLRADFYDRPIDYRELGRLILRHQCLVQPMEVHELRMAVRQPAALPDVQLSFEGNLIGDLLYEVQGQAGALPLLQFTLDQLFQRRNGSMLTLSAYHEIGGVKGALAKHAEETYTELPSDKHRTLARALFLRLIDPGLTEQDTTRRRAPLDELTLATPEETELLQQVTAYFIAARLLTTGETAGIATIEVSHEALIREWPRLADWLWEAREDVHLQQAISEDVAEWEQRGQPRDRLYRGSQLKEARAWARRNTPSGNEVAFLRASAARRVRSVVSVIAVLLLVVASISTAGWFFTHRAPDPTRVTNLNGEGPGSLRQAIDTSPTGSTITFDAGLSGTIILTSSDLNILRNLTIRGPVTHTISVSSGSSSHIIHVLSGVSVTISNLVFKDSKLSKPIDNGFIINGGTLTLTNSAVSGNSSSGFGGGIYNYGTLTLTNSTVSGNTITSRGFGGGIFNQGGTLTLTNSTISDNTSGRIGGGIAIISPGGPSGSVTITFSTIYGNRASDGADIAINDYSAKQPQVKIRNSIIVGDPTHPGQDIEGMLTSSGYNLFQDNSGATFDPSTTTQHGTDKLLSTNDLTRVFASPVELRNNGGPTKTLALAPGSPAIDQIPLAACHIKVTALSLRPSPSPTIITFYTDQRGMKRPDGNEQFCDIGAYEYMDGRAGSALSGSDPLYEGHEKSTLVFHLVLVQSTTAFSTSPEKLGRRREGDS